MNKKLVYTDNSKIICSNCEKPRYMGITTKNDSELCTCSGQDKIPVYDNSTEKKQLLPIENFMVYE